MASDGTSGETSIREQRQAANETNGCAFDMVKNARVVSVGTPGESSATAINSRDICRGAARRHIDGNEGGRDNRQHQLLQQHNHQHQHHPQQQQQQQHQHQHHHHQHHHPNLNINNHNLNNYNHQQHLQNNQPKVRRSSDQVNKNEDENINFKDNNIQKNNHHYYNHNHNHNHQIHQHNYPHLQYQPAQHITLTQNQSSTIHKSPLQPQVMAHYKFHNDCQSSVLTYEQVKRLDSVMDQVVPIHGRGNSPTLFVKLKELIRLVKYKLQHEHSIEIRDVRLNGGASNYVLAPENSHYNDLDLVFGTDLSSEDRFDVIRDTVLGCLMEFYPREGGHDQFVGTVHYGELPSQEDQTSGREFVSNRPSSNNDLSVETCDQVKTETNDTNDIQGKQFSGKIDRSQSLESDNLLTNVDSSDVDSDGNEALQDENLNEVRGVGAAFDEIGDVRKVSSNNQRIKIEQSSYSPNYEVAQEQANMKATDNGTVANQQATSRFYSSNQQPQYQFSQMPLNNCAIKEAYVHKMVKVNDDDRWSLISLGVQQSEANNYNQHNESTSGIAMMCGDGLTSACSAVSCQQHNITDNQQKQLPNSIELKFVDRMRRKFEFSVDSFQIILDSLIQFYDYAPQSTITIQRKLSSSNPSSTMVNICPMIARRSSCCHNFSCGIHRHVSSECCSSDQDEEKSNDVLERESSRTQAINKFFDSDRTNKSRKHSKQPKNCIETSLNGSRSYFDLPLQPDNSLSNSSVASSSGCSSSSSVVSSSSSSLSCDEDNEDLYCDVDNSPSSSASTSSLLCSTTASAISSVAGINDSSISKTRFQYDESDNTVGIDRVGDIRSHGEAIVCEQRRNHISGNEWKGSEREFETSKLSCAVISENFYPTVIGRSEYGNFKEALYHLEKKLIATRSPEEIRGGGLLKYCNLLVKNYKPTNALQIRTLERYMCSRFFIDFSDLSQQRAKLDSYLANHFLDDPMQKFHYLTILHNVVQRSTVCLMNHELKLTLNMIRDLAYELNEQQHQQQGSNQQQALMTEQRVAVHQQPSFSHASRQNCTQQQQYQLQQRPTMMQSGAYRVKLVKYALAQPIKS